MMSYNCKQIWKCKGKIPEKNDLSTIKIWVRSCYSLLRQAKEQGLQESWEWPFTPPICPHKKRSQKGHFDNGCTFSDFFIKLVGDFNPFQKYARQNGFIFPNFRGENKTYLSWHHLENFISCDRHRLPTKCDNSQHFDPKLPHSRSHTKAEGFRLSCARWTGVNRYEFFTVGSILGPQPYKNLAIMITSKWWI